MKMKDTIYEIDNLLLDALFRMSNKIDNTKNEKKLKKIRKKINDLARVHNEVTE